MVVVTRILVNKMTHYLIIFQNNIELDPITTKKEEAKDSNKRAYQGKPICGP